MLNIQLVVGAVVLLVARGVHGSAGDSTIVTFYLKLIEANQPRNFMKWTRWGWFIIMLSWLLVDEEVGVYPRPAERQLPRPGKHAPPDWCTSQRGVPRETMWIESLALAINSTYSSTEYWAHMVWIAVWTILFQFICPTSIEFQKHVIFNFVVKCHFLHAKACFPFV